MKTIKSVWNIATIGAAIAVISGLAAAPNSSWKSKIGVLRQDRPAVSDDVVTPPVSPPPPQDRVVLAPEKTDDTFLPPMPSPQIDDYTVLQYWQMEVSACRGSLGIVHPVILKRLYGNRYDEVVAAAQTNKHPASYSAAPASYARKIRLKYNAQVENGCINGHCPAPIRPED